MSVKQKIPYKTVSNIWAEPLYFIQLSMLNLSCTPTNIMSLFIRILANLVSFISSCLRFCWYSEATFTVAWLSVSDLVFKSEYRECNQLENCPNIYNNFQYD